MCYSRKDASWLKKIELHLNALQLAEQLEIWSDQDIGKGELWRPEIADALSTANAAVLVVSADFLTSEFIQKQEVPRLLRRYRDRQLQIFPVIVRPCVWKRVPWLDAFQAITLEGGEALSLGTEPQMEKCLSEFAEMVESLLKIRRRQSECLWRQTRGVEVERVLSRNIQFAADEAERSAEPSKSPDKGLMTFYRIQSPPKEFFGRDAELERLMNAWSDSGVSLALVNAFHGVGKSALVSFWLQHMLTCGALDGVKVFGWTFAGGAWDAPGWGASAREFFDSALEWFGDPRPGEGDAVEKALRLATLIRGQKTLLLLDGLEPSPFFPGEIRHYDDLAKEQGILTLLRELSAGFNGLCLAAGNFSVTDVRCGREHAVLEIVLENLEEEAGAALLSSKGVWGSGSELRLAVEEYGGHALALSLLGHAMREMFKGDIRLRNAIGAPASASVGEAGFVRPVLTAVDGWLDGAPERWIWYLAGLFNEPAPLTALMSLMRTPGIMELNNQALLIDGFQRHTALERLQDLGLVRFIKPEHKLYLHPLIRIYGHERLKTEYPQVYKAGISFLKKYFAESAHSYRS